MDMNDASGGRAAPPPGAGITGLSPSYRVVAALALAIIGLLACVHLAFVFLDVAPSNTLSKRHTEALNKWIYPEFEQNWKLFAPNPLQQNIDVQARAEVQTPDGEWKTDWIDLSAEDGRAIRGSLLPSHVDQNELRRGWDFFVGSHDNENRRVGLRGALSESYLRRIAVLRLSRLELAGPLQRVQVRSATSSVGTPGWSDERISTRPVFRQLPWWSVTASDLPTGPGNGMAEPRR
jgi:hypothetical protein